MNDLPVKPTKVVVITGASAGVGRAVAHRFAQAGFSMGLIARDAGALEEVRDEVEKLGGTAIVLALDVADACSVFAAADRVAGIFGHIDVWVNDAMVTVFSPTWKMTPEEFRRVTEVTYLGFVHGTMAALRHMRPANRGSIIQIGSALSYRGIPLQSAYCGAKHAIRGFTDSLRAELIHERSRITLTMLQLPAVNTPQFDWARAHIARAPRPVAPVIEPETIAEAVFRAACKPAREYWIGLSTLKVILGNMLVPGLLDRYLAKVCVDGQQTDDPIGPDRADNLYEPVHSLHRTRGSFSAESASSATMSFGTLDRWVPYAATLLAGTLLGGLLVWRTKLSGPSAARLQQRRSNGLEAR
ncbi:Short-chain dehydrogenase/reductase SDR [Bradyrhizobium vignae]|uniref:Short-chain dehydrogenase/reductase SDR n=1 Tax=Bradyrhizobium vignae TaxID=1549949 RepID=A0A2U3Q6Q9_9BRAD|nr:Short-chain dehydrogenase/reductase SDR [Bradyrhizobium vignae]